MSHYPIPSFIGDQDASPAPNVSSLLTIARRLFVLAPVLLLLISCTSTLKPNLAPPTPILEYNPASPPLRTPSLTIEYQVSLIRDNLPEYLAFLGREVLPIMSRNVDAIVLDLHGLTDIKPGMFYHGHIDYPLSMSGGIDDLMEMDNVILQYHTLENPLLFLPYWKEELRNTHDQNIEGWLDRGNDYSKAMSTPSLVSAIQYTPLTETEAVQIASSWDGYRKQSGLASPGLDMLLNMVYLVDGGKQPLYQESFKEIYTFHSISFRQGKYSRLDNRTHIENTVSPFQVTFERLGKCQELLSIFEEARASHYAFIVNLNNAYIAHSPRLLDDPKMTELSARLNDAIRHLPGDNMIKISSTPQDQQIAYFEVGNYIFAVHGSLGHPQIFE